MFNLIKYFTITMLLSIGYLQGSIEFTAEDIATNANGISSGMYFVQVETGANTAMQKLMLLK